MKNKRATLTAVIAFMSMVAGIGLAILTKMFGCDLATAAQWCLLVAFVTLMMHAFDLAKNAAYSNEAATTALLMLIILLCAF